MTVAILTEGKNDIKVKMTVLENIDQEKQRTATTN